VTDERLAAAIRDAFENRHVPSPGLEDRVVSTFPWALQPDRSSYEPRLFAFPFGKHSVQWAGVLGAALLAVAVVAGLLYSHGALKRPALNERPGVAGPCLPASTTSPSRIGNITRYAVPEDLDYIGGITAGPDCSLWFIAQNASGGQIVKVTTSGQFTEYAVPNAPRFLGPITAGPDGNIWFAESSAMPGEVATSSRLNPLGKVFKLTPLGTFTDYPIPAVNTTPAGLATGSDGNIWFTDSWTNQVFKVTPSGEFTSYAIPTRNSQPGAITAGPDGNIWFIEVYPGKVARITPSGEVTEFASPADNWLVSITSGPDGNLWITEQFRLPRGGPGLVAKMTTSGTFTEYEIPLSAAGALRFGPPAPGLITAGRDGNLWFSNIFAIDSVAPSGVFTEYIIPMLDSENGLLGGMAVGPDGNIWFTENRNGLRVQVGRLVAR
jgi:virginiamycin B lyase